MKRLPTILLLLCLAAAAVCCAGCTDSPGGFIDPILGTYYYSDNVRYLGDTGDTLYSLSYEFDPSGEGIQNWNALDGSDSKTMKITWMNIGDNTYMVKIINPNGEIYGENLHLEGDVLYSESDSKNDGVFLREMKFADSGKSEDPVIGTYKYSRHVYFMKNKGGILYDLYYVFDPGEKGLQYWIADDGSKSHVFRFTWMNLGDSKYMVKIINPDGSIYGENLHLDGDVLTSETELDAGGQFIRVTRVL